MHTSDKQAPRPGTLIYSVDVDDKRLQTVESNTYCVVYEGTSVMVAPVLSPKNLTEFDPRTHQTSYPLALRQAAVRLRERAREAAERATKFDEQAGRFDSKP